MGDPVHLTISHYSVKTVILVPTDIFGQQQNSFECLLIFKTKFKYNLNYVFGIQGENSSSANPLVSDPFSASKKSRKDAKLHDESNEEIITIDQKILAESQSIDIDRATAKNVVQPKIKAIFESKKTETNVNKKKSKDKEEEDEESEEVDNGKTELKKDLKKDLVKYDPNDFKIPSNGKEYNLKMITFNVNGIRASIEVCEYYFFF